MIPVQKFDALNDEDFAYIKNFALTHGEVTNRKMGYKVNRSLDPKVFEIIERALLPEAKSIVDDYMKERLYVPDEISLSKFTFDGEEWMHIDNSFSGKGEIRISPIVGLLYISDRGDFDGGNLWFPVQKKFVTPKANSFLMFNTGFTTPHKVMPYTGGVRITIKVFFYMDTGIVGVDKEKVLLHILEDHGKPSEY
jgi:predicted 2-oxoglutarate/Fe(II)-dependent dioxygenase YbiX